VIQVLRASDSVPVEVANLSLFNNRNVQFLVVDGQPYYRDAESVLPHMWLPCIMCRGNASLGEIYFGEPSYQVRAPENINQKDLQKFFTLIGGQLNVAEFSKEYIKNGCDLIDEQIVKINKCLIEYAELKDKSKSFNVDNVLGRFISKSTLMTSIRLGGGIWEDENLKNKIIDIAFLNLEEKKDIDIPIALNIDLNINEKSYAINTNDTQQINQWLVEQGGKDIYKIYLSNEDKFKSLSSMLISKLKLAHDQVAEKMYIPSEGFYRFVPDFQELERTANIKNEPYKKIHDILDKLQDDISAKIKNNRDIYLSQDQFKDGIIVNNCQKILDLVTVIIYRDIPPSDDDIKKLKTECNELYDAMFTQQETDYLNIGVVAQKENLVILDDREKGNKILYKNTIPDNAYRMIEVLKDIQEDIKNNKGNPIPEDEFNSYISRLETANSEEIAKEICSEISKVLESKLLGENYISRIHFASYDNSTLLQISNRANDYEIMLQEVNSRLLRNNKLYVPQGASYKSMEAYLKQYSGNPGMILELANKFDTQVQKAARIIDKTVKDQTCSEQYTTLLTDIQKKWKMIDEKNIGSKNTNFDKLIKSRNKMRILAKQDISEFANKKDITIRNNLFALLVGLGCVVGVGLIPTAIAMHKSKQKYGSVFFTHVSTDKKITRNITNTKKELIDEQKSSLKK
jgi:uncharacterized protein YqgQ